MFFRCFFKFSVAYRGLLVTCTRWPLLQVSNLHLTGDLVHAISDVSSTVIVNKLELSWIRFGENSDVFHNTSLVFRSVQDVYILADYANCVSDTLLIGLAASGVNDIEQVYVLFV